MSGKIRDLEKFQLFSQLEMRWHIGEVAWMYMWMDEWCQFRQRCLHPDDGYSEHVGRNFLFQPLCIYLFDRTINYPVWGQLPQGGNPGPFWGLKLNLQLNGVSPRSWKGLEGPEFSRFSFSFFAFQRTILLFRPFSSWFAYCLCSENHYVW